MSECIVIQPEHSLIQCCIEALTCHERDYSGNIVIFPGRRPGHFLRKEISELIRKPCIPPAVFSIDDFVDTLYEELLQRNERKISTIDAVYLLYEIHKSTPNRPGGESFLKPELFLPLGVKIYNDLEELYIENIPPERLGIVEESIPELIERNLQSLSMLYSSFYDELKKRSLSSRSTRYRAVAEWLWQHGFSENSPPLRNRKLSDYRIIIAGFYAFTECEKKILKALSDISETIFIFTDGKGIEDSLKALDLEVTERKMPPHRHTPRISLYSSPDTHGEVLKTATILRELKQKGTTLSTDTLILLPSSDSLFPLLHNCLSLVREEGFNISMGYPLYRTPIYSFFTTLMDLVENTYRGGVYVRDYLKFILHPYVKNLFFNSGELHRPESNEITRILAHSIKEFFDERVLNLFVDLKEIETTEEIFVRFFKHLLDVKGLEKEDLSRHLCWIHENTIQRFMYFKDIGDFARRAEELLLFIFHNSTASRHPYFHPFAEGFMRAFEELKQSLFSRFSFSDHAGYFNFFKSYIKNTSVAFEGTPVRGVQVLGLLETRGLNFRRVFALDVNEGVFPNTRREDSLLPQRVREALRLSTYRDRERIIDYYFSLLIKGSSEAYIFSIDNSQMQRSRFVERFIWEKQKKEKNIDSTRYIDRVVYTLDLGTPRPEPVEKTEEVVFFLKDLSYTASGLDEYLSCGISFYYSYVLGLKDQRITEKINLGLITHELLNIYFRRYIERPLSEETFNLKDIEHLINDYFSKRYGSRLDGKTYLLKRQLITRLTELIQGYFIPLSKAHNIIIKSLETGVNIKLKGLNLKGRIDRIEQRDKDVFIIDYKTSYSENKLKINPDKLDLEDRASWKRAVNSVQIPFYLLLYRNRFNPEALPRGLYLLLGRTGIVKEKIEFEPLPADVAIYKLMDDFIFTVLNEITSPDVAFLPPEDMKKTCPGCIYQEVCGTKWVKGSDYS